MPTYDYICDACQHEFEAYESIKADSQTVCPTCHEAKLRRKIGAGAAILFKGSGFYQTDYRSEVVQERRRGRQDVVGSRVEARRNDSCCSQARCAETLDERFEHMIRVKCPICGKAFEIDKLGDLPSFPFCTDRCKLVDLGRWIDGAYAIPGPSQPEPTAVPEAEEDDD